MRYTVVWNTEAEDDLAEIWMASADRAAVSSAANTVEALLAVNPQSKGDEVSEGLRVLLVGPLRILFSVSEDDRLVEIAQVRSGTRGTENGNGRDHNSDTDARSR